MAIWDDFVATLKHYGSMAVHDTANLIPNAGASLAAGAISTQTQGKLDYKTLNDVARTQIEANTPFKTIPIKPSQDLLLKTAVFAEDKIISPYLTRPLSTVGLMTDFGAKPIYADGFQWDDFKTAYNRSKYVSPFQALIKSDITAITPLGSAADAILGAGGVNLQEVDLWDDQSIKKNFHDNVVGKWFTGIGDFVETSVAFAGYGKIIGTATKLGKVAALQRGISLGTKDEMLVQWESDINSGIMNHETGVGAPTVRGNDIIQMAQTTDSSMLIPKLEKYTNNSNLIPLVSAETDPTIIRDLLLADNGHIPALERLAQGKSSDYLMIMTDTDKKLAAEALINNNSLEHLPEDALKKINKAFDDSIARVPEHARFKKALYDLDSESPLMGGTGYMPAEPRIGAKTINTIRNSADKARVAFETRDFATYGGWAERVLGNGLSTRVIRSVNSRMPIGIATFNKNRPFDAIAEINAQFDNIKVFTNGSQVIEYEWGKTALASDYRKAILKAYTDAETDVARRSVIEQMDNHLGHIVARHYGINTQEEIAGYVSAIKNATQSSYSKLVEKGYAHDIHGRLEVDPWTQSQLAEAYRFAPWDAFEKDIIRATTKNSLGRGARDVQNIAKSVFEDGIKYWSFDALARPSFITKQSYMEPIISATIAQGADFAIKNIPNMTTNFMKNMTNRVAGLTVKVGTIQDRKAIANTITDLQEKLKTAMQTRDMHAAEWEEMYKPGVLSPRTVRDNRGYIQKQLKDANKTVESLELELRDAMRPLGAEYPTVPSIANLERRIAFIEQNVPELSRKLKSQIAAAKKAIKTTKKEIISLSPHAETLMATNAEIEAAYKTIDESIGTLSAARQQQVELFGRSTAFKKRYYGKESQYRVINGQYTNIVSMFDENMLGAALRDDLSNARTALNTYAGDMNVGARQAIYSRRAPSGVIDIYHDDYFKELAHVSNQQVRNDPFIRLILGGAKEKDLVKYLEENPHYLEQWDSKIPTNLRDYARDKVAMVNRYYPNEEVKAALLERPLTDIEMQAMLSKNMDRLTAIHPTDFNYEGLSTQSAVVKGFQQVERGLNAGIGRIFQMLAKPENPIRWAYADTKFTDIVAKKANILAKQGVDFSGTKGVERLNALRQSAVQEVIKDTEKTFYTVRRPIRALQTARLVSSFPTATLSAFYRYGRLAVNNPYRTMGFLHYYQGAFGNFGVDAEGNHVTDPTKAQYIIVPGTEDMNLKILGQQIFEKGKPVRLNAKSLGFLLNYPSPSIYTTLSVGAIQRHQPKYEDTMKLIMGEYYDIVFPFGTQTGFSESLTPPWARDGISYLRGDKAKKDYQMSLQSVWDYHATMYEMDPVHYKFPTEKQVIDETNHLYHVKAFFEFASPFGVPVKVDTKPYGLVQEYYKTLFNKYQSQGLPYDEAKTKAGDEMLAHLGADFPVERAAMGNKTQRLYIPPTWEAYDRLFNDHTDLVGQLYDLDKNDPRLVELLVADVPAKAKFNNTVYNLISDPNAKLPNGAPINKIIPTPAQKEKLLQAKLTWQKYYDHKAMIQELPFVKAANYHMFSSIPNASAEMKAYADKVLAKENPDWYNEEYKPQFSEDKSFIWARGLWLITHNDKFMKAHGDSKFWQDAKTFIENREEVAKIYASYISGAQVRTKLLKDYPQLVERALGQWDPQLAQLIDQHMSNDSLGVVSNG